MMLDKYIGIPFVEQKTSFDGTDCYGLVRLFYSNELRMFPKDPMIEANKSSKVFAQFMIEISKNWEKIEEPEEYCVVAMAHDVNHPKIIQHFGLYIGNGKMIHTLDKLGSHIVELDKYKYYIKGYYKFKI